MPFNRFQKLLQGGPVSLEPGQLQLFKDYCLKKRISLQQINQTALSLYKSGGRQSREFLTTIVAYVLPLQSYSDEMHNQIKIRIYNNLSALYLAEAQLSETPEQQDILMVEAKRYVDLGEKVRMKPDISILISRAVIHFHEGQISKAMDFCNRCYDQILSNDYDKNKYFVTISLLLAQIHFCKRSYGKALEFYKKCLYLKKSLPIKSRLGMAYCFFNEGKYQLAKLCFERILALDPDCCDAHMGLAIVFQRNEQFKQYFQHMKTAYRLNKNNPLILLHLAEHFLVKRERQKVLKFCQQGSKQLINIRRHLKPTENIRNDYYEMKGRFNNMIGQTYHMKQKYQAAIKWYSAAQKYGLLWNQLQLAQCYTFMRRYDEGVKIIDPLYATLKKSKQFRLLNDSYRMFAYLKIQRPSKQKQSADFYFEEAVKFNRTDIDLKLQIANYLIEPNQMYDSNQHRAYRILQQIERLHNDKKLKCRPQVYMNMGVILLLHHQYEQAQERIKMCIEAIHQSNDLGKIYRIGFEIMALFNHALILWTVSQNQKALDVLGQILKRNKYHLDSYLTIAVIWHRLGNMPQCLSYLQEAEEICKKSDKHNYHSNKVDRVLILKAYFLYMNQMNQQARAVLSQIKNKDLYLKIFQKSMQYEQLMDKNVDIATLKVFLRPNRQFCFRAIQEDTYLGFIMMMLTVVLVCDKKITMKEAAHLFKNVKIEIKLNLPSVIYNESLFYLYYHEYEASISVLKSHPDRTYDSDLEQLIAFNILMTQEDYTKALAIIKKNILRDPSNLKYRWQFNLITGKKMQKQYDERLQYKKPRYLLNCHLSVKRCIVFFEFIDNLNASAYLKNVYIVQRQKRLAQVVELMKSCAKENILKLVELKEKYQSIKRDLQIEEEQDIKNQKLAEIERQMQITRAQEILAQQAEELRLRREKALQKSKIQQAKIGQIWQYMNEKNRIKEQAKSKKREMAKSERFQKVSTPKKKRKMSKNEQNLQTFGKIEQTEEEEYYHPNEHKKKKAVDKISQNGSQKTNSVVKKEEKQDESEFIKKYMVEL